MDIELKESARTVVGQVEAATGLPVIISEDPAMDLLARITRARDGQLEHKLTVNPSMGDPSYLVAYQCGFILRQYQAGSTISEFAGTDFGRSEVERLAKRSGSLSDLRPPMQEILIEQLYTGLVTQLRSYSIGMRIDQWIHDQFPDLKELQVAAIHKQQLENRQVLTPGMRQMAPKLVFDANATMNAAYAIFSDRLLGNQGFTIPWRSAGYEKPGRALAMTLVEVSPGTEHDTALVDRWAEILGIQGWYHWMEMPK